MSFESEKNNSKFANVAPLGLLGFGLALIMLSLHYANFIPFDAVVTATLGAVGFLAQFIAGIFEFRKGNSYRAVSFIVFSLFFLILYRIKIDVFGTDMLGTHYLSLGFFYIMWIIIPLMLLIKLPRKHLCLQLILGLFAAFNLALCIGAFAQSIVVINVAGYIGLVCGLAILLDFVKHIFNNSFMLDME